MKKSTNKILSLVLALAMVFSLSITAFAAGTATFEITIDGDPYIDETIPVGNGKTVYDVIEDNKEDWEPVWKPVYDIYNHSVMYQALESLMGAGEEEVSNPAAELPAVITLPEDMPYKDGCTAVAKKDIAWSSNFPSYGLLKYGEGENGEMQYSYVYVHLDWVYTVNGERPTATKTYNIDGQDVEKTVELYMDEYVIQNGDEVVLDYGVQVEIWTTDMPLYDHYPYLP